MIGELLKLQSWSVSGKQYQTDNGLLCNVVDIWMEIVFKKQNGLIGFTNHLFLK
jgi:hypothetical protein